MAGKKNNKRFKNESFTTPSETIINQTIKSNGEKEITSTKEEKVKSSNKANDKEYVVNLDLSIVQKAITSFMSYFNKNSNSNTSIKEYYLAKNNNIVVLITISIIFLISLSKYFNSDKHNNSIVMIFSLMNPINIGLIVLFNLNNNSKNNSNIKDDVNKDNDSSILMRRLVMYFSGFYCLLCLSNFILINMLERLFYSEFTLTIVKIIIIAIMQINKLKFSEYVFILIKKISYKLIVKQSRLNNANSTSANYMDQEVNKSSTYNTNINIVNMINKCNTEQSDNYTNTVSTNINTNSNITNDNDMNTIPTRDDYYIEESDKNVDKESNKSESNYDKNSNDDSSFVDYYDTLPTTDIKQKKTNLKSKKRKITVDSDEELSDDESKLSLFNEDD